MCVLFTCKATLAVPEGPHPDFSLEAVPLEYDNQEFLPVVMGMDRLSNGDLVIVTSLDTDNYGEILEPSDASAVYLVSNLGASMDQATVQRIATGFSGLSGVVVVEDRIFVSDRDAHYELVSTDDNPDIEQRVKVVDWPGGALWHQYAITPVFYEGSFYTAWSGTVVPGGNSFIPAATPEAGTFLKFDRDGSNLEIYSGGLRSPNGTGISPEGVMLVADNQGGWLPASTISHMREGMAYGHVHDPPTETDLWDYAPPVVWLPHNEAAVSPSQPVYLESGPFADQWIVGDVTQEGIHRIFVEEVNGQLQGSVFPFFGAIERAGRSAAVNRMTWGPDDALYIGAVGRIGNWPTTATRYPLYKLKHRGTTAFEILAVRSKTNGMEIEFTQPVDLSQQNSWNYEVTQYGYVRERTYGRRKTAEVDKTVSSVLVSEDARRVMLVINDLKDRSDGPADEYGRRDGFVAHIQISDVRSESGDTLWNGEAWYTLNQISPESFDGSTPVKPSGRRVSIDLKLRMTAQRFALAVGGEGPYRVTLKELNGGHLQAYDILNAGTHYFDKPSSHGLYILEVKGGGKVYRQKLLF